MTERRFCSSILRGCVQTLAAIVFLCAAPFASAQEISLDADVKGVPGQSTSLTWRGNAQPGDFVALAHPGAGAAEFIEYARVNGEGGTRDLALPELPGDYVLRYVSPARGMSVLAETTISVGTGSGRVITAPETATQGSGISVVLTDAGEASDFLTVAPVGAPDDTLGPYVRIRGKQTLELVLDVEPGAHEIRQIRAAGLEVLARTLVEVTPDPNKQEPEVAPQKSVVDAGDARSEVPTEAANVSQNVSPADSGASMSSEETLEALASIIDQVAADAAADQQADAEAIRRLSDAINAQGGAAAGQNLEDVLAAAIKSAAESADAMQSEATQQALAMFAGSAATSGQGAALARGLTGGAGRDVSLIALEAVDAGSTFRIIRDGAGMPGDQIAIMPASSSGGTPTAMMGVGDTVLSATAPIEPGLYQIVYLDAQTEKPLASRVLEVR